MRVSVSLLSGAAMLWSTVAFVAAQESDKSDSADRAAPRPTEQSDARPDRDERRGPPSRGGVRGDEGPERREGFSRSGTSRRGFDGRGPSRGGFGDRNRFEGPGNRPGGDRPSRPEPPVKKDDANEPRRGDSFRGRPVDGAVDKPSSGPPRRASGFGMMGPGPKSPGAKSPGAKGPGERGSAQRGPGTNGRGPAGFSGKGPFGGLSDEKASELREKMREIMDLRRRGELSEEDWKEKVRWVFEKYRGQQPGNPKEPLARSHARRPQDGPEPPKSRPDDRRRPSPPPFADRMKERFGRSPIMRHGRPPSSRFGRSFASRGMSSGASRFFGRGPTRFGRSFRGGLPWIRGGRMNGFARGRGPGAGRGKAHSAKRGPASGRGRGNVGRPHKGHRKSDRSTTRDHRREPSVAHDRTRHHRRPDKSRRADSGEERGNRRGPEKSHGPERERG